MRSVCCGVLAVVAACGGGGSGAGPAAPAPVTTGGAAPGATLEATPVQSAPAEPAEPVAPPASATPIADAYRDVARAIVEAAMADDGAWKKLEYLTVDVGARLSGSQALERAIDWAAGAMTADGHENVAKEEVMVPHWVRGAESGVIVAPIERELHLLGLGDTVATPRRGITAEVVVVADFDELAALGESVKGKIVLFNKKMPPYDSERGAGYGETVPYRSQGPVAAAKQGAVAVLVRSVTAHSLRSPHTGGTRYDDAVKKIPAAAITVEDAELIALMAARGDAVKVTLKLSGQRRKKDARSHNVIGEIRGRELPNEVVLIGAHIDSWDVGQGAHDDATGCATVMQALTVLRKAGFTPRRTIRVVLFTNEENGLAGAIKYAEAHAGETHVMALETDSGGFKPRGVHVQGTELALSQSADIMTLLDPIGASRAKKGFGGADLIPLTMRGVQALGLWVDGRTYFDIHHTEADTIDKVDPTHLKMNVATVAVVAYVIADMPQRFGGDAPTSTAPAQ